MDTIPNKVMLTAVNFLKAGVNANQADKSILGYVSYLELALLRLSDSIIESDMPVTEESRRIDSILADIRERADRNMKARTTCVIIDKSGDDPSWRILPDTIVNVIDIDIETGTAVVEIAGIQTSLYTSEYEIVE